MNIALTTIYTATSANSCGRFSFVRKAAAGCLLGCALSSAMAGLGDKEREAPRGQQVQPIPRENPRMERAQAQPAQRQLEAPRQFDPHSEARAEEQRRMLQVQPEQNSHNADATRRNGRLTPDERRDLRRQINEAGQDIYPNTPRR